MGKESKSVHGALQKKTVKERTIPCNVLTGVQTDITGIRKEQ